MSRANMVCVIGAGSSGLAALKNLQDRGIDCECLEREKELGGNWVYGKPFSSIYQSVHLISSKRHTEYDSYPMPDAYPDYPDHRQVLDYLRGFAQEFGLGERIRFGCEVHAASRLVGGGWEVQLRGGETRQYRSLVIANGHNWDPRYPNWAGSFEGESLHSASYKTPDVLSGKRVLVVGGGNSGVDIACESAEHAASTTLSLRRGYHILPKYFHGTPIDECGERGFRLMAPLGVRRLYAKLVQFLVLGDPLAAGFPKPDHRLFETHPVINSRVVESVRHGRIRMAPDVDACSGEKVFFKDGSHSHFDLVIFATGFKTTFPFLAPPESEVVEQNNRLYLNVFDADHDDLFFIGLIQPDSGQFGLVDWQSRCVAEYLSGLADGRRSALAFHDRKKRERPAVNGRLRYLDTPRHTWEVEHHTYRRSLRKLLAKLERGAPKRRAPNSRHYDA